MIVGQHILDRKLVVGGSASNLKNSTFDLTVGEIVPIGKKAIKERRKKQPPSSYYLEPREMVWVLSREEFNMPPDVTGMATLRTAFTKQGILALNVGIIDPFFRGPISTALINFSDRPRRISVGDKFFRIAFFEHDDVSQYHVRDENVDRAAYVRNLEEISYSDFSPNFLNIPKFDDEFYFQKFWSIIVYGLTRNWKVSIPLLVITIIVFGFLLHLGLYDYLAAKLEFVRTIRDKLKI
ncbi:deoxycytidine triphosphate deaminase [Bradyrhizobium sp. USDA 4501]